MRIVRFKVSLSRQSVLSALLSLKTNTRATRPEETKTMRTFEAQELKVGDMVSYLHTQWNWETKKADREIRTGRITRIESLFTRYFYLDNSLTPHPADTLITKGTL